MIKNFQAEIIGVGTELLLGQISNTNAQWISDQLARVGISVYHHQVVGDNLTRTRDAFALAAKRSDIIFVTGGLGPTDDDLTREALQLLTGKELLESETVLATIQDYFSKSNRTMTENNRKQAKVFPDAVVIPNHSGTAPGMIVPYQESYFILMPGVPNEMKKMMEDSVLPYLRENFALKDVIKSKMMRFIGIGESQLETLVRELIDEQSNPTIAPLATDGEVALRITAKANTNRLADQLIEQTENDLKDIVGDYYYGADQMTINEAVCSLLKTQGLSISAAESLTGGKFADAIVSIPGASTVFEGSIVSYTPNAKQSVLGVSNKTIVDFGVVSEWCALEMAKQAKSKFDTDIGISFTGVAGPNSLENKQVGTVYISIYQTESNYLTKCFHFSKNRELIRERSVKKGLELLYNWLKKIQ